jgi:hypothetical protein
MNADAQIIALLTEIREQQTAILAALRARNPISNLLYTIHEGLGDHNFCAVDFLNRVPAHIPSPHPERIRAAVIVACGSASPKLLGNVFEKYQDADIDGLVLRQVGEDSDGRVWKIEPVSITTS